MPGASLWLIPPPSSTFNQALQTLITKTIPSHFSETQTHHFIPHVTVTSNIEHSTYAPNPQAWIGSLDLHSIASSSSPAAQRVPISLECLEAGDVFFKKLTLRAEKTTELTILAALCRAEAVFRGDSAKASDWARGEYMPHLSLMYADLPTSRVHHSITTLNEVCRKAARSAEADDDGVVAKGGRLVLVDTTKPISDWNIIAERDLPHLLWAWPWSKSDFDD